EFAPPFVVRVSDTPPTDTVVDALTTVVPGVAEVSVIVQEPVFPAVVHGFGVPSVPGPDAIAKLIEVPAGALTKPAPSPRSTSTWPVSVCVAVTGLIADAGVIVMRASTHVFVAGPELPPWPFVETVMLAPLMLSVEAALQVSLPVVGEFTVTVA